MSIAFQLDTVTRRFGKVLALDKLSLTVQRGEVYGFLGRNGAGKSTTLKILMGIIRPDDGYVEMFGERVKRISVTLKQRIGYVAQEPGFYPWMTASQLGKFVSSFYPKWDHGEYTRLLTLLDVPTEQRASELSGGTRTKLGLALALAPMPELLLLDEPTAGLDPVARREFNDQLIALQRERGTTIFFSSHLVDEVQALAHRVGIVQAGQARYEGDISELRASVRRLQCDAAFTLPDNFQLLRGDVYRAAPTDWDSVALPEACTIHTLSLEDIFLAFARTDVVLSS